MKRRLALCLAVLITAAAAPRRVSAPASDPFRDGTDGSGPPLVAVPGLDMSLGGDPAEPGYRAEELRYRAVLSPYAIGATEVTNEQYCRFLNEEGNVTAFGTVPAIQIETNGGIRHNGNQFLPAAGRERRPVTGVSWQGARAYCRWLTRKTGRRYDLPTAAQWEAAARAGTTTTWPWGNQDDPRRHHTRARGAGAGPLDVGSFPPNGWGLHDTTGNVWEWVLDCYNPELHRYAPLRDPVSLDDDCLAPEVRGGSFRDGSAFARPAFRANYWWAPGTDNIGFRVAREPGADERRPK